MIPDAPHILVVDDDERLRALLNRFLSENGFRVSAAADAAEARAVMEGLTPDLLVLDVMMPGIDGLTTWKAGAPGAPKESGSVSGPMQSMNSMTEPGHPCTRSSGVASGRGER